ncbi:hypothetical protein CVIRNUC_010073 [Coccomyxa viridis]|uniref:S-acyltransferase n=1 Tax=Coccomyxa viridis TaxID=1274662 RepID=A0AAV1ILM6_9CHLO|nr:hypothetical protein CVIRNUC_010073 [Coccomyxa viridis]
MNMQTPSSMHEANETAHTAHKEQVQVTVIARVAYLLLHIFILSTVFRCNAAVQDSWLSSSSVYIGGFTAAVLLGIALYIALTFMHPGYIATGTMQHMRVQQDAMDTMAALHEVTKGSVMEEEAAVHVAPTDRLHTSPRPAFDFESLLQGPSQLPDLIRQPIALERPQIRHEAPVAMPGQDALGESSLLHHLSELQEGLSGTDGHFDDKSAPQPQEGRAPKQAWHISQGPGLLGGTGTSCGKSHACTELKADVSHGRYSEDSSASELIGAVHASMHEEDSAAQEPLRTRSSAWWETPGMPGRPCERCGAFQRLRAHHCTACERCVDTHDHHCLWLGTCIGARNQAMYLCFLAVEAVACAWSADGMLPCLTDPHPLLPWHTVFGLDWRVVAALVALGLLLPYLTCLLAFQLYLAATAQTARECLRRHQIPYLMHVNERVKPFSRGCIANLWEYCSWRRERHWELPSTEELLQRHSRSMTARFVC